MRSSCSPLIWQTTCSGTRRAKSTRPPYPSPSSGTTIACLSCAFPALRRTLGVPAGEPLFFSLQRLGPEKRVEILLRAMRHYLDGGGTGMLMIGGKGPEEGRLRALAAELGIQKQVLFAGYIPREDV